MANRLVYGRFAAARRRAFRYADDDEAIILNVVPIVVASQTTPRTVRLCP